MHILVGQGNAGAKYLRNRHNLGFMVMDAIASDHGFGPWRAKFQSQVCEGRIGTHKVLLMKPDTFYNETGRAAQAALNFYKLSAEDVTVFHDEIDLAPGRLRVKRGGGHSGNNGIRSMIAHVGAEVRRIRMGIGHPGDKSRVMPYVLSDFAKVDEAWKLDKNVAEFNHDLGHSGMGMMLSTYHGDGSYPVYVRFKHGRPAQVVIDFEGYFYDEDEDDG